jgi:hypothetical protein
VYANGEANYVSGTELGWRDFDIQPSTAYTFTVVANNSGGASEPSNEVQVITPDPSVPGKVTITDVDAVADPVIVRYQKIVADPPVQTYRIECEQTGLNPVVVTRAGNLSGQVEVPGLNRQLKGNFTAFAINSDGTSAPSDVVTAVLGLPNTPNAPALINATSGEITITQSVAAATAEITEFVVARYREKGQTGYTETPEAIYVEGGELQIDGLAASTTYEIGIKAVNSLGSTAYSPDLEVTTNA